jgi:hypothetical protein
LTPIDFDELMSFNYFCGCGGGTEAKTNDRCAGDDVLGPIT